MTTLTLKSYQQSALDALAAYARAARIQGPAAAFAQHAGRAYNACLPRCPLPILFCRTFLATSSSVAPSRTSSNM